jgi:predicted permease
MMSKVSSSVRYAAKGLLRAPQFTITAAVTLALAIGANASIFSVVQGILLKPLRFHDSDRLVLLTHSAPGLGYDRFGTSPGLFFLYRSEGGGLESSGIFGTGDVSLTGDDVAPERVTAGFMSRDVFVTLGEQPALGRIFDEGEDRPNGEIVVILSDGLWRERFAADRSVLGRTIRIDGEARTVVGVMPPGFEFPNRLTRLWMPVQLDPASEDYGNFSFQAIGRLGSGIDPAEAQSRLQPVLSRLRDNAQQGTDDFRAFVDAGKLTPVVSPLKEQIVGQVSRALWILLGTVGFVFLIACANVTNLFLVRAEARQKEMAVRAALGARRGGLISHYLAESALIACAGGVLGLGLTWLGLRALLRTAPPNIPRLHEVTIDPVVLLFTFAAVAVAAMLLAILPTIRLTSADLLATMSRSARGSSGGRERNRARQILVVAQTALALVLLVGSGLMVRSFQNLRSLDPGFDARDALTFRISLPNSTYSDEERVSLFHAQLLDRLRALPGVQEVGASSNVPLTGCCSGTAHVIEDHPTAPGELPPMFWYSTVSDGYFEAMRIPVLDGRSFGTQDRDPAQRNVIVSQDLARRFWPGGSAVGKRIRFSADTTGWNTIVGVAGDVRAQELEREPGQMVYYPASAGERRNAQNRNMTYVIRASRPDAIVPLARKEVWALDANLPIAATSTLEKVVADSMVRLSFTMLALVVASAVALLLGAIGLYGVISYVVAQRTNEIGIRLALGARPDEVRRMVVLQGVRLSVLGLAIGLVAALGLTRLMQGMLFATRPNDPATFVAGSLFLGGIALFASYLPARRASRIDPASSLRTE